MRWLTLTIVLGACVAGDDLVDEHRLGGDTTIDDRTAAAFTHPAANLDEGGRERHQFGVGPFNFQWSAPQLGPLFNNDACLACHGENGRGLSQIGQAAPSSQALVRCSLVTEGEPELPGGQVPVPGFGTQLQDHASVGLPEVFIEVQWLEREVYYEDGAFERLRDPRLTMRLPNGDPIPAGMSLSYRQGLPVFGLGLLEAIPDDALLALADPDDANGDGISGRANVVWDVTTARTAIGRFGHKASAPTLLQQTAAAFVNDIGLTNRMFHDADNQLDVANEQLDDVTFFVSTIAVPAQAARDGKAYRGSDLFDAFGCASCHVRTHVTGDHPIAALAHQTIHPYTDLLLHDVGDELTDARPDFLATGREWRTPPLWGVGLAQRVAPDGGFLHDGRARTLVEAILWHGGEAEAAMQTFRTARATDRAALIAFLQTL